MATSLPKNQIPDAGGGCSDVSCSLLPCPFCGQKDEKKEGWDMIKVSDRFGMMGGIFYVVECLSCDATTGWKEKKVEARKAWNSRSKENV